MAARRRLVLHGQEEPGGGTVCSENLRCPRVHIFRCCVTKMSPSFSAGRICHQNCHQNLVTLVTLRGPYTQNVTITFLSSLFSPRERQQSFNLYRKTLSSFASPQSSLNLRVTKFSVCHQNCHQNLVTLVTFVTIIFKTC